MVMDDGRCGPKYLEDTRLGVMANSLDEFVNFAVPFRRCEEIMGVLSEVAVHTCTLLLGLMSSWLTTSEEPIRPGGSEEKSYGTAVICSVP